jgi:hypothetical protein
MLPAFAELQVCRTQVLRRLDGSRLQLPYHRALAKLTLSRFVVVTFLQCTCFVRSGMVTKCSVPCRVPVAIMSAQDLYSLHPELFHHSSAPIKAAFRTSWSYRRWSRAEIWRNRSFTASGKACQLVAIRRVMDSNEIFP